MLTPHDRNVIRSVFFNENSGTGERILELLDSINNTIYDKILFLTAVTTGAETVAMKPDFLPINESWNILNILSGQSSAGTYMITYTSGIRSLTVNPPGAIETIGNITIISTLTEGSVAFSLNQSLTNSTGYPIVDGETGKTVNWSLTALCNKLSL